MVSGSYYKTELDETIVNKENKRVDVNITVEVYGDYSVHRDVIDNVMTGINSLNILYEEKRNKK